MDATTLLEKDHDTVRSLFGNYEAAGERAYRYSATRERAEHAADRMYAFLETDADRRAVLARFVGRLSAADRRAILDLLRARSR